MSDTQSESRAVKAAAFLVQALELDDHPAQLAADVVALKRDPNAGISTLELESSVGPAAFLIYDYQLAAVNEDGITGQELFDADLRALEQAAATETPGPRILAHAISGDEAYILATTPAIHRALTGQGTAPALEANDVDHLPGEERERIREDAANELLRLLRDADAAAQRWLQAIRAEGTLDSVSGERDFVEFGEAEAALALYVLDDRSIQHLLRSLNLLVSSAKQHAERVLDTGQNGGTNDRT